MSYVMNAIENGASRAELLQRRRQRLAIGLGNYVRGLLHTHGVEVAEIAMESVSAEVAKLNPEGLPEWMNDSGRAEFIGEETSAVFIACKVTREIDKALGITEGPCAADPYREEA